MAELNAYQEDKPQTTPVANPAPVAQNPVLKDSNLTNGSLMPDEATQQQAETDNSPKTKAEKVLEDANKTGKSFVQMYHETVNPPVYDSETANTIQRNKNLSVLGDIIRLVGEGATTSKGGSVIPRQSQVPQLNAQLQQLNDLYKKEYATYKQNEFNYLSADEKEKRVAQQRVEQDELRKELAKQSQDNSAAQKDKDRLIRQTEFDARQKLAKEKEDRDAEYKKEQLKHQKEQEKIGWARVNKSGNDKEEKNFHVLVNGSSTKVPESLVNDVAAREKSAAAADPSKQGRLALKPEQLFSDAWSKYYSYVGGQFVPKQQSQPKRSGKVDGSKYGGKIIKK